MQSADRHQLLQDVICLRLTAPLGRVAGEGDKSGELGGIFLEARGTEPGGKRKASHPQGPVLPDPRLPFQKGLVLLREARGASCKEGHYHLSRRQNGVLCDCLGGQDRGC